MGCGSTVSQPAIFFWDQRLAEASLSSRAKFRAELRGSSPGPFHYSSAEKGPSSVSPFSSEPLLGVCVCLQSRNTRGGGEKPKRRSCHGEINATLHLYMKFEFQDSHENNTSPP